MTDIVEKPLTQQESELIDELRRAKLRSKRHPETYIIRIVDGITQLMIADPFALPAADDKRHLDKRKGRR